MFAYKVALEHDLLRPCAFFNEFFEESHFQMKNSNKESTVASVVVQRLNAMFLILFQVQPVAVEEDWGQ